MDEFKRMAFNGCLWMIAFACIVALAIYGAVCLVRNIL